MVLTDGDIRVVRSEHLTGMSGNFEIEYHTGLLKIYLDDNEYRFAAPAFMAWPKALEFIAHVQGTIHSQPIAVSVFWDGKNVTVDYSAI